ncbi:hypothetical protein B0H66DRAFT_620662 [Apodospora peruviana]|uniref:SET domain-containing protein n=1 Tax=Apodospora peruviana TaxID=516989 RepID=A0AAE0ICZ8_9PEZI|nr:hypothetical protein B0H66DRAFT_620662 [Apodospora peruviana]
MVWCTSPLRAALVLGLLGSAAIAESDAKTDKFPKGGSSDGLAYEQIQKKEVYTENATSTGHTNIPKVPPVDGWWYSKICTGAYCVFTNRKLANGRGLVMVTKMEEYQKIERTEEHFNKADNKYEEPIPWAETEIVDKGPGITATKNLRRGKALMSWTPVLAVSKDLFADLRRKDRTRLLEIAVSYLPDATRERFDRQRRPQGLSKKERTVEQIILAAPFEFDLGYNWNPDVNSKHYLNYPEVDVFTHDCRPNVAWHIDGDLTFKATVARRIQAGDELTIAYVDPFVPREERTEWVRKHRGLGKPCPCQACSPGGGKEEEIKKADERWQELLEIQGELKNHESKNITPQKIQRFLDLVDQEKLNVKLADAYENAALNYNYLGMDRLAKKYADLAVQAAMVEEGTGANNVIALRIMAGDIKGHYSYQYTLKRQGKVK